MVIWSYSVCIGQFARRWKGKRFIENILVDIYSRTVNRCLTWIPFMPCLTVIYTNLETRLRSLYYGLSTKVSLPRAMLKVLLKQYSRRGRIQMGWRSCLQWPMGRQQNGRPRHLHLERWPPIRWQLLEWSETWTRNIRVARRPQVYRWVEPRQTTRQRRIQQRRQKTAGNLGNGQKNRMDQDGYPASWRSRSASMKQYYSLT